MTSDPSQDRDRGRDDERLARYLLGELSGDDEAALDEALILDEEMADAVRLAEDDLLDAYVCDRLSRDRRARLEARLASSPRLRARLPIARALHDLARRAPAGWPSRLRAWLSALGAARLAMVGVAAAVLLVIVWPRGHGPSVTVSSSGAVALVLLPTTRGDAVPEVAVAPGGEVALTVVLDPEDAFPRYRLRIGGAGGAVWSQEVAAGPPPVAAVRAQVPASALPPGDYQLELTGLPATGEPVALGSRGFRAVAAAR